MGQRFAAESIFTYAPEQARQTIWDVIHDGSIVLVDEYDGILTGFVLGYVERDFCQEACAYIRRFYVEREFRGLGVSIDLINAFEKEAMERGARFIFTASHTKGGKLYANLLARLGYTVLGQTLSKEL
jgi:GNAT superfamily N-acetyltransferase